MFVHQGKLDHILPASAYSSGEAYRAEQLMFKHHWHVAGLSESVRDKGGYVACEIHGIPIIVHHGDSGIVAFRNVCAHRHSMLCPQGVGSQSRLTCQYHGWQYSGEGRVCKVPDGQSFKGIKSEDLRLDGLRAEVCGPFVLVCFDNASPSFRSHLGEFSSEFDQCFGQHRLFGIWQTEHNVNWKIVCENAVESYHVPLVHPTTFGNYRASELHDHKLAPTYSRYADLQPWDRSFVSRGFRLLAALLLQEPNFERFKHTHIYPNHLLYYGDLMSTWTVVEPLSANRCRYRLYSFVPANIRWGGVGRLVQRLSSAVLMKQFRKILGEDMELWPKVHEGLAGSRFPGVLSCREERIWAFQKYLSSYYRTTELDDVGAVR